MVLIPILNRYDTPQSVRERHLSFTESESLNRKWSRWTTYLSAWFTAWNNLNTADEKLAVVADYIDHPPAEVTEEDVDGLDIDSDMITVPTIGLREKVLAASAEYNNINYTPPAILLAYDH